MSSDPRIESVPVNPADHPAAWEHPPTRRAWMGHMGMNVVGLIGWAVAWIGLLVVLVGLLSQSFIILFLPLLAYTMYRAVLQLLYFPAALRMRRILRVYPWQVVRSPTFGLAKHPKVHGKQHGWFEFPNPARPDQELALVFPHHMRTEWWNRRMAPRAKRELQEQIEVIWFAGDPRFIGLIAAPTSDGLAPRRLHILRQQMRTERGLEVAAWGATAEDIERGRLAGSPPSTVVSP
ncbi:hypothetical protein AB0I00_29425 [Streptomyces sp. NPDC050803]|uniref:hypothetical protein n=1 Tax=unclassified Streptomyces TaxID=2593676 RepID=UPI00344595E2